MSNLLVVAELQQDTFRKSVFEAVCHGKKIAKALGASVHVLIPGSIDKQQAAQLGEYGADEVLVAAEEKLKLYNADLYKSVIVNTAKQLDAQVVLFSATFLGKDLAPRVTAALDMVMASDITGYSVDGGNLQVVRPMYAGKVLAKLKLSGKCVISLRPNIFGAEKINEGQQAPVKDAQLPALESKVTVKEFSAKGGDKLDVADADIIITGGRGLRSAENFAMLEKLAALLNAAVGATRAAVDSDWRPHGDQVGQTGKVVSPKLYVMVGASGSIQHWAGMSGSKCIVAINKDPNAPIIQRADYSVVGDLFEILPVLTAEIEKNR
ncbi:electron transfer flavoprotein subunit alpha/FixB family protein [candidate division KSB1 bacterium]|nr:electron transfer flavoprotein subunit alpha/FixB family protein [candidate division KSB1 bacterium]